MHHENHSVKYQMNQPIIVFLFLQFVHGLIEKTIGGNGEVW